MKNPNLEPNVFKLRKTGQPILRYILKLPACRKRSEILTVPAKLLAEEKITNATERCQDLNLEPNVRAP